MFERRPHIGFAPGLTNCQACALPHFLVNQVVRVVVSAVLDDVNGRFSGGTILNDVETIAWSEGKASVGKSMPSTNSPVPVLSFLAGTITTKACSEKRMK